MDPDGSAAGASLWRQVIVFSTAYEASKETSFDHPNIPAVPLAGLAT